MSVEVRSIVRRFGSPADPPAVNDVSFTAKSGAITTLLGPSGSGKSTLLRLVAGLEEPDAGTVHILDRDVTRVPVRQREVGFVFQNYALFRHMTVSENIGFGLSIRKTPKAKIQSRVAELLHLIQLEGYGARFPSQLSGGQRQRVALARALATTPKVLLLDEPFGALDAQVRLELRRWLLSLHERIPITTLLVTHDQDEALELSEHVVLLHQGCVAQAGAPHELYDRPANDFVASFLGAANVLAGRVRHGKAELGGLELRAPDGVVDGAEVRAFVRPREVRVFRAGNGASQAPLAKVERLTRIGGVVKLSVALPNGESLTVELSKQQLDELGIEPGDRVVVDMGNAKVFVEDYAI